VDADVDGVSSLRIGRQAVCGDRKGQEPGPNNFAQRVTPEITQRRFHTPTTYIATLLYGSLARWMRPTLNHLPHWTSVVLESNRMKAAQEKMPSRRRHDRIKHVYIIKENRTYDQILET